MITPAQHSVQPGRSVPRGHDERDQNRPRLDYQARTLAGAAESEPLHCLTRSSDSWHQFMPVRGGGWPGPSGVMAGQCHHILSKGRDFSFSVRDHSLLEAQCG